jgi:Ca-activated chloride channel homolog
VIHFGSLEVLVFLLAVVLMAGTVIWAAGWRRRAREQFAGGQASTWTTGSALLSTVLLLTAGVLIVVAAARPQWGSREQVRDIEGVDVVIALDISLSMLGTDVQPNRLRVAQDQLVALIDDLRGNRIGVVFFAGSAIVRSPLTTDTQALTEIIRRAETERGLVRAGSDLGAALQQASRLLDASDSPGKAVILVSDGEDHAGQAAAKARELAEKDIVVFAAGVGTPEGSTLQERTLLGEMRTRLDANGNPIITRLDESTLVAASEVSGGRYVRLTPGGNGMGVIRGELARLQQTPSGDQVQRIPIERFQYFAAAAFVLLCLAWLTPARLRFPSRLALGRRLRPHPGLTMVLLALIVGVGCGESDPLRAENQAANALFNAGDYDAALEAYQRMLAQRPDIDELSYNVGNALHRLGRFERAVQETRRALPPTEPLLGAMTYYALGNHFLAQDRLQDAYQAYRSALLLDPTDADAKHNLEYVLLRLNMRDEPPGPGEPMVGPPQPGEAGENGGESANGEEGDVESGEASEGQSDGSPGDQVPQDTPRSPTDIRRDLAEALAGLDEEISPEEAIRILDLLREQRQTQTPGRQLPGGGPDY